MPQLSQHTQSGRADECCKAIHVCFTMQNVPHVYSTVTVQSNVSSSIKGTLIKSSIADCASQFVLA